MPEESNHDKYEVNEEDLETIRQLRRFRRILSVIAALIVLIMALVLALTSGRREKSKRHGYNPSGFKVTNTCAAKKHIGG